MGKHNGIGYGDYTPQKQKHFEQLLALQHRLFTCITLKPKNYWMNPTYHYFDINAGCGHDPTGAIGSPLIFHALAAKHPTTRFAGFFLEREEVNHAALEQYLHDNPLDNCQLQAVFGDHTDTLPRYFRWPRRDKMFGLLYADPSGVAPPFDLLADFASRYKRIDLLIYLSATNIKRKRAVQNGDAPTLIDELNKIRKDHWIIREPQGAHQWTFLLGSNWLDYPAYKSEGFYPVDSVTGYDILNRLNYTVDERQQQQQLNLTWS